MCEGAGGGGEEVANKLVFVFSCGVFHDVDPAVSLKRELEDTIMIMVIIMQITPALCRRQRS